MKKEGQVSLAAATCRTVFGPVVFPSQSSGRLLIGPSEKPRGPLQCAHRLLPKEKVGDGSYRELGWTTH